MSSIWSLPPADRAVFATTSRFLSSLVTESILKAFFIPISSREHLAGVAVVLSYSTSKRDSPYGHADVFAVAPLRQVPIFKPGSLTEIGLLNPLDMLPYVYELYSRRQYQNGNGHAMAKIHRGRSLFGINKVSTQSDDLAATLLSALARDCSDINEAILAPTLGPLHLWKRYADASLVDKDVQDAIAAEFSSSLAWQQHSYEHPPPHAPTFDSPSIAWEQCVVEGHPIHPMHKARHTIAPVPSLEPGMYDWYHPQLRLVAVPRTHMRIFGAWDDLSAPLRSRAAANAGKPLDVLDSHVVVPVHELQVASVCEKLSEARVLPEEYRVDALAQQNIRTLLVPSALPELSLKLALAVRLVSAIRTINPKEAYLGPHFSSIVPLLTYDRSVLVVEREVASFSYVDPDPKISQHLAGVVREAYENTSVQEQGERVIVCTALTELGYSGVDEVPLVQTTFGLDTEEKRIAWLDRYVELALKAFLPPMYVNGVGFEAHPQNTLARFDVHTRELKGFVIRDLTGLCIHPATVCASTGVQNFDSVVAPGHSIMSDTLGDVYTRMYQTLFDNHLQHLIRVLGLHYNGRGWEVVRRHLVQQIPEGHELRKLWLSPEAQALPGKCFMRMRLQDVSDTGLHSPFPSLLCYQGHGIQGKSNV